MTTKRILVSINKVLTGITTGLLVLFVSIPFFRKPGRVGIALGLNILLITILLFIIAAYGGAFSRKSSGKGLSMISAIVPDTKS
jgi:hypothetical protein